MSEKQPDLSVQLAQKAADLSNMPKPPPMSSKEAKETEETVAASLSPTVIEKFAKRMGYAKKPKKEPESSRQFKIAWLQFLVLLFGDIIIFLGAAISFNGEWALTAILWRALMMSAIKDLSTIVVGKMLKYFTEEKE